MAATNAQLGIRESVLFSLIVFTAAKGPLRPKAPCYQFPKSSHTFVFDIRTPDSIVGVMNSPRAWWWLVRFPLRQRFASFPQIFQAGPGVHPSSRLMSTDALAQEGRARILKITSHLHLVPSLWMIGATFLLHPYLPSWRGQAQLCINCVCAADWQSDVSHCFFTWRKTTLLLSRAISYPLRISLYAAIWRVGLMTMNFTILPVYWSQCCGKVLTIISFFFKV